MHELHSALIANLGDMIFLTDRTGAVLFTNATTHILGFTQQELNTTNFYDLLHPADREPIHNVYEAIAGMPAASYVVEYRMRRKNGEYIWAEGKMVNMLHHRAASGIITTVRDITEQKQAYDHVQESEKQFRRAFEQVAMGMANISVDGQWLHMNAHLCDLTGFSYNELYYMNYADLFIETERKAVQENMKYMLANDQIKSSGQRQILKKDGSFIWVEELLTLIRDEEGADIYFTLVLKDIDAVKNTEMQLAYRNKELDTFIYRASHDLRGPVVTILGLTDIAMLDTRDEEAQEYLRNCRDVAARLEKTVYDLLAVTQVKRSKSSIMSVLPREIIYRTMHDKKHTGRLPHTIIDISVDDDVIYNTDAAMIGIIITQLMDNALIFRRPDTRHKVDVKIIGTEASIKIVVRDNGIGIDPQEQNSIFDLYYRGKDNHTGAGIGLYLVKSAVEKLEGSVRVNSTLNEGTEVMVYLPNCTL